MYNGMLIQNLDIADVSSERRNPILANVMAQLDSNQHLLNSKLQSMRLPMNQKSKMSPKMSPKNYLNVKT